MSTGEEIACLRSIEGKWEKKLCLIFRKSCFSPGYRLFRKRYGERNIMRGYVPPIAGVPTLDRIGRERANFLEFIWHADAGMVENIKQFLKIMSEGKIHLSGKKHCL